LIHEEYWKTLIKKNISRGSTMSMKILKLRNASIIGQKSFN
ncbi:15298_t:CDS:1, partial [Funneliformis geosporum]